MEHPSRENPHGNIVRDEMSSNKKKGRPVALSWLFLSGTEPEAQDSFIDSAVRICEFDLTLIARRPRAAKCTAVHPDKEEIVADEPCFESSYVER